jgi:O-antigen ligase/tetratricopeptide (TPR) repeat protein
MQHKDRVKTLVVSGNPSFRWEPFYYGAFFLSLFLVFSTSVNVNFALPKLFVLRLGALAIFLYIAAKSYKRTLSLPPKAILFAILGMAAWFTLSTLFATHPYTALHGVYGRYNGLLNQLLYLGLCLSAASTSYPRATLEKIVAAFIVAVVPVAIYTLLQHLHLDPLPWPSSRPASTIGHPVMVAAIIGLAVPFCLYFMLVTTSRFRQILCGTILVLFLTASAVTLSRGPWVGTIVAAGIVLAVHVSNRRKQVAKILCISVIFLISTCSVLLLIKVIDAPLKQRMLSYGSLTSDNSFMTRLIFYDAALEMLKLHPVVGTGFETFRNLYPGHRSTSDSNLTIVPTMVHNGYLQYAQSTGIPGLTLYVTFLAVLLRHILAALRKINEPTEKLLLVAFSASLTGFLIQDLSGWQEISLTPLFWLLTGLTLSACKANATENTITPCATKYALAVSSLACLCTIYLVGDAVIRFQADYSFSQANQLDPVTEWTLTESRLLRAVELVPGEVFYRDQAGLIYNRRYAATGDKDTYNKGMSMFNQGYLANPYDSYILLHAVELNVLAIHRGLLVDPSPLVKNALEILPVLDKNNAIIHNSLAKLELALKHLENADIQNMKANQLHKNQAPVDILTADLLKEQKRYTEAFNMYRQIQQRLEKENNYSDKWVHVRLSIASILFSQGKYVEELHELSQVTSRVPSEIRSYIMQGDAWAARGTLNKAQVFYEKALQLDPNNQFAQQGLKQVIQLSKK